MTDKHAGTEADAEGETPAELTSQERLRALTNDRKPKRRPGTSNDPARRPGDLVDAVRERTVGDQGRITPQ
jgi:hypothetical protein